MVTEIGREKGLDSQSYQCKGCSRPVGISKLAGRPAGNPNGDRRSCAAAERYPTTGRSSIAGQSLKAGGAEASNAVVGKVKLGTKTIASLEGKWDGEILWKEDGENQVSARKMGGILADREPCIE